MPLGCRQSVTARDDRQLRPSGSSMTPDDHGPSRGRAGSTALEHAVSRVRCCGRSGNGSAGSGGGSSRGPIALELGDGQGGEPGLRNSQGRNGNGGGWRIQSRPDSGDDRAGVGQRDRDQSDEAEPELLPTGAETARPKVADFSSTIPTGVRKRRSAHERPARHCAPFPLSRVCDAPCFLLAYCARISP
jgi:hypothetical protein